ncbi:uncharacterized protein P884DRAFT_273341 [Thermothelomyces heterothallicus CBS 202.75]|uniref:uncharacterized protein n=1 Tax=Thermothelomyces heterothallicus CBS 202.75 TaxID=1149848 RepID=UPI0037423091
MRTNPAELSYRKKGSSSLWAAFASSQPRDQVEGRLEISDIRHLQPFDGAECGEWRLGMRGRAGEESRGAERGKWMYTVQFQLAVLDRSAVKPSVQRHGGVVRMSNDQRSRKWSAASAGVLESGVCEKAFRVAVKRRAPTRVQLAWMVRHFDGLDWQIAAD